LRFVKEHVWFYVIALGLLIGVDAVQVYLPLILGDFVNAVTALNLMWLVMLTYTWRL